MRVLVACEFSGIVRDAFIARGHDAVSCDLLPTERPGPHIQGDVIPVAYGGGYDLMIAHPPCTYLCNSGVRWLHGSVHSHNDGRWDKMEAAAQFFLDLLYAPISKIAIENPIQHKYARARIPKYDQIVQPYWFGDEAQKATCLWLKGLPRLSPTKVVGRGMIYVDPRGNKHGGECTMRAKVAYSPLMLLPRNEERWKIRSRTFQGIADAMAEQYGGPA